MKSFSAQHRTQTLSGYETTGNPVVVRMQKERPILMCGAMVRSTLGDSKRQTRRAVNPQPTQLIHLANGETISEAPYWTWRPRVKRGKCLGTSEEILKEVLLSLCPYGEKGDRLWVKETFYDSSTDDKDHPWTYRADCPIEEDLNRDFVWKPSIFMPRRASRITLEITEVRVERLNEITEEDAIAEGIRNTWSDDNGETPGRVLFFAENVTKEGIGYPTAKQAFQELWDSINAKTFPWSSNPWVFAISFKRV